MESYDKMLWIRPLLIGLILLLVQTWLLNLPDQFFDKILNLTGAKLLVQISILLVTALILWIVRIHHKLSQKNQALERQASDYDIKLEENTSEFRTSLEKYENITLEDLENRLRNDMWLRRLYRILLDKVEKKP